MALAIGAACGLLNWQRSSAEHLAGTLGISKGAPDHHLRRPIVALAPDSPLRTIGAQVGDSFEFAHRSDAYRSLGTDESVPLNLYRGEQSRQVLVRAVAVPPSAAATQIWINFLINGLMTLICLVLGVMVGMRGANDRAMRILSLVLLIPTLAFLRTNLPGGVVNEVVSSFLVPLGAWIGYCAFVFFALQFPAHAPLLRYRGVRRACFVLVIVFAIETVLQIVQSYSGTTWVPIAPMMLSASRSLLVQICVLAAILALAVAWRRSAGAERQRLTWVGVCMGMIFATFAIYSNPSLRALVPGLAGSNVLDGTQLLGYSLLGYAMLRYRLFDIGFAINRTLVFSASSAMLILVFFLTERFAHQFLHFDSAENNALLSGAIAFGLFFAFNRLHHRVDHVVEKLLFHSWHANAAALDSFVHKASHYTSSEHLLAALGDELDRFTGHAGHALYRANAGAQAGFDLVRGNLPGAAARIGNDDDMAVTLRTRRGPAELRATSSDSPGELALPMMHGANLYGIAIVGAKPNGNLYRPDEVDSLAFAVSQVGLDLFALRVQQLEAEHNDMVRRAATTEDRLGSAMREVESIRLALSATSMRVQ